MIRPGPFGRLRPHLPFHSTFPPAAVSRSRATLSGPAQTTIYPQRHSPISDRFDGVHWGRSHTRMANETEAKRIWKSSPIKAHLATHAIHVHTANDIGIGSRSTLRMQMHCHFGGSRKEGRKEKSRNRMHFCCCCFFYAFRRTERGRERRKAEPPYKLQIGFLHGETRGA